jgi:hypothetical protein
MSWGDDPVVNPAGVGPEVGLRRQPQALAEGR